MRLTFKWQASDHLEIILATRRAERLWRQHKKAILQAFEDQTGLKFYQRQITVRLIDGEQSYSGAYRMAMQLSRRLLVDRKDQDYLATLTHELAHRLLAGHGLKSRAKDERTFNRVGHERIYLFLYDVWVQAFDQTWADQARARELSIDKHYTRHWQAAMSLSHTERQAKIAKLSRSSNEPHLLI